MKKMILSLVVLFGLMSGAWAEWGAKDCPKPDDDGKGEVTAPVEDNENTDVDSTDNDDGENPSDGENTDTDGEDGDDGKYTDDDGEETDTDGEDGDDGEYTDGDGEETDTDGEDGDDGEYTDGDGEETDTDGEDGDDGEYTDDDGEETDTDGEDGNDGEYTDDDGEETDTDGEDGDDGEYTDDDGEETDTDGEDGDDGEYTDNDGEETDTDGEDGDDGEYTNTDGDTENGPEASIDVTEGVLIDTGLGEGQTVLGMQQELQDLVDGKYTGDGEPSVEDIINIALEGIQSGDEGGPAFDIDGVMGGGFESLFDPDGNLSPSALLSNPALKDPWSTIGDTVAKAQGKLESWATDQINSWISKHPGLEKWFGMFGINGDFIVDKAKSIWGILTGNGTLSEKFAQLAALAQNTLCDMVSNAIRYGLQKLTGWLSDIANNAISKITSWIQGKIQSLFGIKVPTGLYQGFQKALQNLVGKGLSRIMVFDPEVIVGEFRPQGGGNSGSGTTVFSTGSP